MGIEIEEPDIGNQEDEGGSVEVDEEEEGWDFCKRNLGGFTNPD